MNTRKSYLIITAGVLLFLFTAFNASDAEADYHKIFGKVRVVNHSAQTCTFFLGLTKWYSRNRRYTSIKDVFTPNYEYVMQHRRIDTRSIAIPPGGEFVFPFATETNCWASSYSSGTVYIVNSCNRGNGVGTGPVHSVDSAFIISGTAAYVHVCW